MRTSDIKRALDFIATSSHVSTWPNTDQVARAYDNEAESKQFDEKDRPYKEYGVGTTLSYLSESELAEAMFKKILDDKPQGDFLIIWRALPEYEVEEAHSGGEIRKMYASAAWVPKTDRTERLRFGHAPRN